MTTLGMHMLSDAQSDSLEVGHGCGNHGAHDAHGGTPQTMMPKAAGQQTHTEIATLGNGGVHDHAHPVQS
jgi:hypothetical protein